MGNLAFIPLEIEEDIKNLFSEFGWLEEKGELIKESRISFDFKVIDEEHKCYDIYRFFGGLSTYLGTENGSESNKMKEVTDINSSSTEYDSFLFDKTILQSFLKYSPSLNGQYFEDNNEPIINKIVSAISVGGKIKKELYPNIILYEKIDKSGNYLYVKREMLKSTIRDQLYEHIEVKSLNYVLKSWLEFQSIIAVTQLHSLGLFHGDIKTENMLINHLYTVKLTDISPWKPVFIDSSDLRAWTVFFESQSFNPSNNNILRCNLSPERFLSNKDEKEKNHKLNEQEFKNMLFSMDVFSLGCIINEIESGEIILTINDALKMSKGKKHYSEISNNFIGWIQENFLDFDWKKRPTAFNILLKLLNMTQTFEFDSLNIYLFDQEKINSKFCKSFPLFFYPLSIIMQNKIFNDLQIQIIILNIVLPVFLELYIIKGIYPNNKTKYDNLEGCYKNGIENVFSKLEIEYFGDWNPDKLKFTFQNKFESSLMKDLIFGVLLSSIDNRIFNEGMCLENESINSYLNIKGFFSIFQTLLNHWNGEKSEFCENLKFSYLANHVIMSDNQIQLNINDFDIGEDRKSFFELIKNEKLFVEDLNESSMLYLHYLNVSLRQINNLRYEEYKSTTDNLSRADIFNGIYLVSINTMSILFETLSEEYKEEVAMKEILPTILQYITIDETLNSDNSVLDQLKMSPDLVSFENGKANVDMVDYSKQYRKEPIVIFEIFNFINNNIIQYITIENGVLVDNETNKIIYNLIILNIDKWIYSYVTLKSTLVVNILLLMANKVLPLILENRPNISKLNIWITEILTSNDSTLKKSILRKNERSKSILEETLEHFLLVNRTETFISEILPYLIDQLNDKDIDVRSEFCEFIIKIIGKLEIIFILPYGKFCLEKCLSDNEFQLKQVALKSINSVLDRIISSEIKKLSVNESDIIVHELVESTVNNLNSRLIISYYPLFEEFGNLIRNILKYSKRYNNWLSFLLILDKIFNIKEDDIRLLFDSFELNEFCENEFLMHILNKLAKHQTTQTCEKQEETATNLKYQTIETSSYTNLISYSLPCIAKQLNLHDNFDEIIFISSVIQKESKFGIRKKIILQMVNNLTNHKKYKHFSYEHDIKKPQPSIKGNYLGSIYTHRNLAHNCNNMNIGAGYNIYQNVLYTNNDVYSCSTNSSTNSEIYLHKLNVYDQFHYWNLITDQSNNYIFKFSDSSYITSMNSLSSEFSVVTGNNLGVLTKIHIDSSAVAIKKHWYNDNNLFFKQINNSTHRSPMITLIGKVMINLREMIISVYCNGDILIIDSETLGREVCFSVPPFMGSVIDYYTDQKASADLIFFVTDENIVIVVSLLYSKIPKIWKISHHELKITNIANSYFNKSSNIMLFFNKNGIFANFDWISGIIYSSSELTFKTIEINENSIHMYSSLPSLSSIHPTKLKRTQTCSCMYCQTQRIRIFGNYLNQYLASNKHNGCRIKKECLINKNVIGPFNSAIGNCLERNCDTNKYYIFNDEFGNVYQHNFFVEDSECSTNTVNCIIGQFSVDNHTVEINNTKSYWHKDTLTSLNTYMFNDNSMGLLTSSRDGIISYWN
ncbi:WD40 repeat-containing protein kinase [Cryptosporidium canis]|uniref:WD40 repeat-containing protein kinase n=1 Tax=Cryptosporidium canis TaxID=195482 RepID=A0ABQ8P7L3_9CRYT|nr:WD40 repeat-containing protein kinase [Cryptosporidium canis]KAJ1611736.1 WD40 repeat-containing protein kinase [Cryptosporidium canis]